MRLLIITQKVDENDAILGFFHGWIIEFAKHCKSIIVICLEEGEHHLPENVKVLSLGKESFTGFNDFRLYGLFQKFRYVLNFWKYIWQERNKYDAVFVHMNQEYVFFGGLVWKLLGKKITMWRNHAKGSWATRIAVLLSDTVFCTSPQSFTAQFKKTKIMPVGIDTNFFKQDPLILKKWNSILFLGRIALVKNVDIFIEALKELKGSGMEFYATIAGSSSDKDAEYEKMIRDKVIAYNLGNNVMFTGAVSQIEALKLYREHELYVNLTPSGSMDKTIFEAMATGMTSLVSNIGLKELLDDYLVVENMDINDITEKITQILNSKKAYNLRDIIVQKHSIERLMVELNKELV